MTDAITSYRARWIVPIDRPPIEGGIVSVRQGRIVDVGRRGAEGTAIDLGDVALLPALVNAHVHLEFSHLGAPVGRPGTTFAEWIPQVIAARLEGPQREAAIDRGLDESWAGGAGLLGEIARPGAPYDVYAPRDDRPRPAIVAFRELTGPSLERAESLALAFEGHAPENVRPGLSPHAPYTVHPRLLARAVAEAQSGGWSLAMHLGESPEEVEFLRDGGGALAEVLAARGIDVPALRGSRRRPGDYLPALAAAPRALVVHGNYLEAEDYELLAEHRQTMSLVHCPRTHEFFAHPPFPLDRLLAAGVRVALGTDSRASNPDLNMLSELRAAGRRYPQVPTDDLLQMVTWDGALALGDAHRGKLSPGAPAQWLRIPVNGSEDPVEQIVRGSATPVQSE